MIYYDLTFLSTFCLIIMTLLEYTRIKDQVIRSVAINEKYGNILKKLKVFYRADIDSDRKFEKITSIGQLLNILEKRDVVSEDNLGPLKDICWRLQDQELLKQISDFENSHIPREYTNFYAQNDEEIPKQAKKIDETNEQYQNHHPLSLHIVNKTERKDRIIETIKEEIGCFWRDLGRNLNIQECKIQEIDEKYNTTPDKVEELMTIFEKKVDRQRWFLILCNALEKSRRKDLSKSLNEIMTMNL